MTSLKPLVFELHTDQRGGSSGLISYGDTPVHQALSGAYGAPFNPDNYQAPGMNVSLLELSATPDNWTSQTVDDAATKLYQTLMGVEAVRNGTRPLHFFAGHGDVTSGQTGAPGEKGYVKAVKLRLKELASGNSNFSFYDSITDPNDPARKSGNEETTNWGRGSRIVSGYNPDAAAPAPVGQPNSGTDTPKPDAPVADVPGAVERVKKFKAVANEAGDVVKGFGNDFDSMKSSRLAEALRGAQTDIIKERMKKGENFGTKLVEVEPEPKPTKEDED